MKHSPSRSIRIWCALPLLLSTLASTTAAATLQLQVRHAFRDEPLQLGSLRYTTGAGESFSVTRLSYLLSDFAFQRGDGSWEQLTNSVAWFDAESGRLAAALEVAPGQYRGLRFALGLDTSMNHADPARFAADHPLNPNLNGLHWSWQGGYVFLALEGRWRDRGLLDGWSYHLARDTNRATVLVPIALSVTGSMRLELNCDLEALFSGARGLSFGRDGSSTHSRDGDPIAAALVSHVTRAFTVRSVSALTRAPEQRALPSPDLPPTFTPYRFTLSSTFPTPELPRDNPLIEERVALGKKLFHEPLLSRDASLSCASCHDPNSAFTDARRFSVGTAERIGTRNSMPLLNLAWKTRFFWDGRAASLREQVLMPIQDHAEMDETLARVISKLQEANYTALFAQAFSSAEITADRISLALEQFLLTLTSFDSKFDRAMRGDAEFTTIERRGLELFMTEYDPRRGLYGADCFHCHGGVLFQSQSFANNGVESVFTDRGRAQVTGRTIDEGKFAVPSLRNVALTGPYMHDGRFATLEDVVKHYSSSVKRSPTLDPNLAKHPNRGLGLRAEDQRALVAFLRTLTDPRFVPATNQIAAGR